MPIFIRGSGGASIPTCEVTIKNNSSYNIMGVVVTSDDETLAVHWNGGGNTREFTTNHPFALVYQANANISISASGVEDLGTKTNNTFESVLVHAFKPNSDTVSMTIT